jgi:hypothetical protein
MHRANRALLRPRASCQSLGDGAIRSAGYLPHLPPGEATTRERHELHEVPSLASPSLCLSDSSLPPPWCHSGTKTKLAQTIYDLRSEMDSLQNDLNSRRAVESRQQAERSALLLQLETLNGQLVETSKRAGDWEIDANKQAQVIRALPLPSLTLPSPSPGQLWPQADHCHTATAVYHSREPSCCRRRLEQDPPGQVLAAPPLYFPPLTC